MVYTEDEELVFGISFPNACCSRTTNPSFGGNLRLQRVNANKEPDQE